MNLTKHFPVVVIIGIFVSGIFYSPQSNLPASDKTLVIHSPTIIAKPKVAPPVKASPKRLSSIHKEYLEQITAKYKVSPELVKEVLRHVDKYSHSVFPKREDLLAVIGIESSWRPNAVSSLRTDPAVGLTQIRPGVWNKWISSADELDHIENQIKYAYRILRYNFKLTESAHDAIIAYNVGYGNWLKGKYTDSYITKFINERETFRRG